jgi:hypothetical protein
MTVPWPRSIAGRSRLGVRLARHLAHATPGAVAMAAAVVTASASASFPGRNGTIAITLEACGGDGMYIRAYSRNGSKGEPITPPCELTDEESGDYRWTATFDWFPDGQRLLYFDGAPAINGLATIASDGSGPVPVVPPIVDAETKAPIPWYDGASLAPDGQHFAFEYGRSIWISNLARTEFRRLRASPNCGPRTANCVRLAAPRWSPDGRLIAAEAHQDSSGPGPPSPLAEGVWLLDATTGKLIRRVAKNGHEIDWAPDGRRLVYRTTYEEHAPGGGTAGGDIFTVRVDGRGRNPLVRRKGVADTVPVWSPDGRWITWASLRFGAGGGGPDVRASLWRVRAQGGRPRRLTRLPSPSGEGLYTSPDLAWQPLPERPPAHP